LGKCSKIFNRKALKSPVDIALVHPRRKAGQAKLGKGTRAVLLTRSDIEKLMPHHRLSEASKQLGLSVTTVKKVSRKLGIRQWNNRSSREDLDDGRSPPPLAFNGVSAPLPVTESAPLPVRALACHLMHIDRATAPMKFESTSSPAASQSFLTNGRAFAWPAHSHTSEQSSALRDATLLSSSTGVHIEQASFMASGSGVASGSGLAFSYTTSTAAAQHAAAQHVTAAAQPLPHNASAAPPAFSRRGPRRARRTLAGRSLGVNGWWGGSHRGAKGRSAILHARRGFVGYGVHFVSIARCDPVRACLVEGGGELGGADHRGGPGQTSAGTGCRHARRIHRRGALDGEQAAELLQRHQPLGVGDRWVALPREEGHHLLVSGLEGPHRLLERDRARTRSDEGLRGRGYRRCVALPQVGTSEQNIRIQCCEARAFPGVRGGVARRLPHPPEGEGVRSDGALALLLHVVLVEGPVLLELLARGPRPLKVRAVRRPAHQPWGWEAAAPPEPARSSPHLRGTRRSLLQFLPQWTSAAAVAPVVFFSSIVGREIESRTNLRYQMRPRLGRGRSHKARGTRKLRPNLHH